MAERRIAADPRIDPYRSDVNECDPLRDEGINFYRLLLGAGVPAQCRQVLGTIHGTEIFPMTSPDISRETAASIARFCRTAPQLVR
jgi:acetyl esterase